jgi:hypothetical protein
VGRAATVRPTASPRRQSWLPPPLPPLNVVIMDTTTQRAATSNTHRPRPRWRPLLASSLVAVSLAAAAVVTPNASAQAGQLVANSSMETVDPTNAAQPQGWTSNSWGTISTTFSYPSVGAHSGARFVRTAVSSRTTGDAKWMSARVPVAANTSYTYSDFYRSSAVTYLVVEFVDASGQKTYRTVSTLTASSVWKQAAATFVTPATTTSLRVFHLVNRVGTLDVDTVSLTKSTTTTTPTTTAPPTTTTPPTAPPTAGWPAPSAGASTGGLIDSTDPIAFHASVGSFRTICTFSHVNNDDSIVFPGKVGAAHNHTYFGNTGSNANSTGASLLTSGNSTCDGGTLNRSSYWVPTLYDASGKIVKPMFNRVYYKSGYSGLEPDDIVRSLPQGLKILAGNAKATAPSHDQRVFWSCVQGGTHIVGRTKWIPNCPQGTQLKAEIEFGQCWNGQLDSADHKSHIVRASFGTVECPSTHPYGLPEITYNIHWYIGTANTVGWRLSSDMYPITSTTPGGYSLHGDFFSAWDKATMDTIIANCIRKAGDCSVSLVGNRYSGGTVVGTKRLQHAVPAVNYSRPPS